MSHCLKVWYRIAPSSSFSDEVSQVSKTSHQVVRVFVREVCLRGKAQKGVVP
jgi:hypothetical protein